MPVYSLSVAFTQAPPAIDVAVQRIAENTGLALWYEPEKCDLVCDSFQTTIGLLREKERYVLFSCITPTQTGYKHEQYVFQAACYALVQLGGGRPAEGLAPWAGLTWPEATNWVGKE